MLTRSYLEKLNRTLGFLLLSETDRPVGTRYLLLDFFGVIQGVFQAGLHQTGLEAEALQPQRSMSGHR